MTTEGRSGVTARAKLCPIALTASIAAIALTARASAAAEPDAPAATPDKVACVAAVGDGQLARYKGKLRAARAAFVLCARTECPAPIRNDCSQWLGEVIRGTPTLVVVAKDARGRELVDVKLSVDGASVSTHLDGKAMEIDPGVHELRCEAAGAPPAAQQVVVHAGEKDRVISFTLQVAEAPQGAAPAPAPSRPPPPVLAYVLGGVGVAALGVAAVLDLTATGDAHDLRGSCAPSCAPSDVDSISTKYLVAGVSLGVGVVALAVATYLLFAPHAAPASAPSSALFFGVRPTAGGVTGDLGARF